VNSDGSPKRGGIEAEALLPERVTDYGNRRTAPYTVDFRGEKLPCGSFYAERVEIISGDKADVGHFRVRLRTRRSIPDA
jgi:hypothetical protein